MSHTTPTMANDSAVFKPWSNSQANAKESMMSATRTGQPLDHAAEVTLSSGPGSSPRPMIET